MKLEKIYKLGLIKDNTEMFIRQDEEFHILAHGNWYQDNILNYMHHEIESFTWQDDNKIYVDIKEQNMRKLTVKDIINLYGEYSQRNQNIQQRKASDNKTFFTNRTCSVCIKR